MRDKRGEADISSLIGKLTKWLITIIIILAVVGYLADEVGSLKKYWDSTSELSIEEKVDIGGDTGQNKTQVDFNIPGTPGAGMFVKKTLPVAKGFSDLLFIQKAELFLRVQPQHAWDRLNASLMVIIIWFIIWGFYSSLFRTMDLFKDTLAKLNITGILSFGLSIITMKSGAGVLVGGVLKVIAYAGAIALPLLILLAVLAQPGVRLLLKPFNWLRKKIKIPFISRYLEKRKEAEKARIEAGLTVIKAAAPEEP